MVLFNLVLLLLIVGLNDAEVSVKLYNGKLMPIVGTGTCCGLENSVVYRLVKDAIEVGYRHVDTAYVYGNEKEVGQAINEEIAAGTIKREDIFLVTKVWNTMHSKGKVREAVQMALDKLKLGYIDLMLMHWPMGYQEGGTDNFPKDKDGKAIPSDIDYIETYQTLEEAVNNGTVKSIGLSNFNHEQIERVLQVANIKPAVNQFESHPLLTNTKLIEYCHNHSIAVTAYSPLGNGDLINHKTITDLAAKHNVTAAQVLIRFHVQRGVIVIPRSTQRSRIEENIDVFSFQLTPDDMKTLQDLNQNKHYYAEDFAKTHKYYPFNIPY